MQKAIKIPLVREMSLEYQFNVATMLATAEVLGGTAAEKIGCWSNQTWHNRLVSVI